MTVPADCFGKTELFEFYKEGRFELEFGAGVSGYHYCGSVVAVNSDDPSKTEIVFRSISKTHAAIFCPACVSRLVVEYDMNTPPATVAEKLRTMETLSYPPPYNAAKTSSYLRHHSF